MMRQSTFLSSAVCAAVFWGTILPANSAEFITTCTVNAVKLLPAPPSNSSDETKAELKLLCRLQKKRNEVEIERCKAEAKLDMTAFQPVFGSWFTPENLPEMHKLLKQIHEESKSVSDAAKRHFDRPRPGKLEPELQSVMKADDEPSYPSGHATRGILYAMILSAIEPAKQDSLLERGREIGWDRAIAGVHYPSDIAAGRTLGQALGQSLLADPNFRDRLKKVKAEYEVMRAKQEETMPVL
jgi:acid phosphatase (class A)